VELSARFRGFSFLSVFAALCACSSDPDVEGEGRGSTADKPLDANGPGPGGDGDGDDGVSGGDGDAAAPGPGDGDLHIDLPVGGDGDGDDGMAPEPGTTPSREPEVCDGKDNDGDGEIDNVDAGGDGICDCLNIGTIGRIGPWSNGGDIFKDWLDARSPLPALEIGDQELSPELLEGLNVVVVLRADTAPLGEDGSPAHHEFSEAEVAAMEAWVNAGGGLMTTIGYQGDESSEVQNVNRLLHPFGLGYDPELTELNNGFLADWNPDHPISNGVFQIAIHNGVEPYSHAGTVVARGERDRVGIVAGTAQDGHVIVFGDEWVTYDSEWADVEEQQVELLWLNMIKWMSPPRSCQVAIPPDLIVR